MINNHRLFDKYLFVAGCLLVVLCGPLRLRAQACPTWPADCPVVDYASLDQADDSTDKLNNPVVPQEVAMEHRLRRLTNDLMNRIAEKEHWNVAELIEDGSSGFRTADGSVLKYELRPSHSFHIVYQVIVNSDSLVAWSDWLKDLSNRRLSNMQEYSSQVTAHPDKAQALQQDAAQKDKKFEIEKKTRGLAWRDATVLLVEFDFNGDNARVEDGHPVAGPGAVHWYSIPEPDPLVTTNYYSHSKNAALALTGAWNPQPNAEGFYTPRFVKDKTSIKNIKSDKVQTIALTLSGNRGAMKKFLSDLPAGELNTW